MITINVSMYVKADGAKEAYAKLQRQMAKLDENIVAWESSDDWYDGDGDRLSKDAIDGVIRSFYESRVKE
jgi:hypothetical protein